MKDRNLRITWSVASGIIAVLLIALWARSYSRLQIVEKQFGSQVFQISSVKGHFAVACLKQYATIRRAYLSVVAGDASDWRKEGRSGFAYHRDGTVTALVMPHWLYTLALAAFAAAPWLPSRFSLRTLLIAMALIAVALWLVVRLL